MEEATIVYVAQYFWEYEGGSIIGVFDTREAAQAACDNYRDKDGNLVGDFRDVSAWEINEVTEYPY